jgi:hypothetical protein
VHVPIKFWDDAFLTATYLINRMPTRVLDNTSPIERLLHTPPNYSMMRVFGCACWPHLRAYNKHKLSFRYKECVFLGYSSLHKGYKCLDRESGRVYVSRDVIFDEHVFSFHRDSQNSGSTHSNFSDMHVDNSSVILSNDHVHAPLPANPLHAEDPGPSSSESLPSSTGQPPAESSSNGAPMIGDPAPAGITNSVLTAAASSASPTDPALDSHESAPSTTAGGPPDIPHAVDTSAPPSVLDEVPAMKDVARPAPNVGPTHQYGTRFKHNIWQPKKRTDDTVTYSVVWSYISKPTSHVAALKDPLWRQAMDAEFRALLKNNI